MNEKVKHILYQIKYTSKFIASKNLKLKFISYNYLYNLLNGLLLFPFQNHEVKMFCFHLKKWYNSLSILFLNTNQ